MPSLKDLKNRIESVKSTRKITKAMQMVAAAKLRRAQEAAEMARPYAEKMEAVMGGLAQAVGQSESAPRLLAGTGSDQVHLLVVMTAERGLCGGFNSSIVKLARQRIDSLKAEGKTVKILTVGKKGREQLKRDYADLFVGHVDLSDVKRLGYANAADIARPAGPLRRGRVRRRHDLLQPLPVGDQPGPDRDAGDPGVLRGGREDDEAATLYDYEPSEEGVLADLLPRGVATQIFTALLENAASEQGARMSAMDNATRNAGEMIDRLTIEFNRSRQAVITNELIEIISGAEAL
jgi:F-type H+-transporting ATPase subunit gamma